MRWAHRSVSKDQNKAHAAAWAATVAGAKGSDSAEMERVARLAAKDKQAVNTAGASIWPMGKPEAIDALYM
jgi:hypothetical protein